MDIQQLNEMRRQVRNAQHQMQLAIHRATTEAMSTFRKETGLSPQRIEVNLLDVSTLCDEEAHYIVENVRATITL